MRPATRSAGPADARVVAGLLRDFDVEFGGSPRPAQALARRFEGMLGRDDVAVELALVDDEVSGFAFLTLRPTPYSEGPLAQLEELYVLPDRRGEGIGTVLLTASVERVRALGCTEVHIGVDEIDHDTRRFYERHGFTNIQPGADHRMLLYLREL